MHNAQVFKNSFLDRKTNNGELFHGDTLEIIGGSIPIFLIGDSAYPLLSWLFHSLYECQLITKYTMLDCHGNEL